MTPQEFEPLGLWMGWEKKRFDCPSIEWWEDTEAEWWEDIKGKRRDDVSSKTSLTDSECVEVLNRLVDHFLAIR